MDFKWQTVGMKEMWFIANYDGIIGTFQISFLISYYLLIWNLINLKLLRINRFLNTNANILKLLTTFKLIKSRTLKIINYCLVIIEFFKKIKY